MLIIKCPKCRQTTKQTKAGFTPAGSQRRKCGHCNLRYTPEAQERGYDEEVRLQALQLRLEGFTFRQIGRVLDVNHQTIANWMNDYTTYLPPTLPESISDLARLDGLI